MRSIVSNTIARSSRIKMRLCLRDLATRKASVASTRAVFVEFVRDQSLLGVGSRKRFTGGRRKETGIEHEVLTTLSRSFA